MSRRPRLDKHPRLAEIDQALMNGVQYRVIAGQFDVALGSLTSRAKLLRANQPPASISDLGLNPVSLPAPTPAALSPRGTRTNTPSSVHSVNEHVNAGDLDLFDVASMSFPWQPGEVKPDQQHALRLRRTQRLHGIAAVRTEALHLVSQFLAMRLSAVAFAKMLDIPPEIVPRWQDARREHDRQNLLQTDPADRAARELAELEDAIAACNERLSKQGIGDRSFTHLTAQKTKLLDQRTKLLERYGLDHFQADVRDAATKDIHDFLLEAFTAGPLAAYETMWTAYPDAKGTPLTDEEAEAAAEQSRQQPEPAVTETEDEPDTGFTAEPEPEPLAEDIRTAATFGDVETVASPPAAAEPEPVEAEPAPAPEPVPPPRPQPQVRERARPFEGLVLGQNKW